MVDIAAEDSRCMLSYLPGGVKQDRRRLVQRTETRGLPGRRIPRRVSRALAIVVAIVVGVAAVGVGWWVYSQSGSSGTVTRDDGPTLYAAYDATDALVRNASGGPWVLFWGVGIAAQAAFSPNVLNYFTSENLTVNNCEAMYNGLTIWNGSIPIFNGTLNSGTAPFWQFAFYSNATNRILFATDVLDRITVYPSEPNAYLIGNCMPWYDLSIPPDPGNWTRDLQASSANSPTVAGVATTLIGQGILDQKSPWAELFYLGPGMYGGTAAVTESVAAYFDRCGLEGVSGFQPLDLVATTESGGNPFLDNESTICALLNSANSLHLYPAYYQFEFSASTIQTKGSTLQAATPYQAEIRWYNYSNVSSDAWGLANWLTSWNLTTSAGQHLPLATPICESWAPSVSNCGANSSGWYGVVLSASGEWTNSYGALPGGGVGWSEPVTALVSHQQFVIVTPSSWNVTSDVLSVSSTVSTSTVVGSDTL